MVGVFDGKRYRWYRTVDDFLACELNRENRGKWFYAHAGGLADVQFLLEYLIRKNYAVKASFSGSSAIIVHVGKGFSSRAVALQGNALGHDVFHFVDSYWLLRDTLRNIGKSIGLEKGGVELTNDGTDEEKTKAWFRDVDLRELVAYNEQDCVILWKAIDQFQMKLWQYGGQLQMTLASSAMNLFRRRFLTDDIITDDGVNDDARLSYVASRVEVFERECKNALYFDINSSFPFSMTQPLPGNLVRGGWGKIPRSKHYLARCDVSVPETYLPPLPKRAGGRVFFPVGRWIGWFNNVDLDLLLQEGGTIHRIFSTYTFEPFNELADYAQALYALRKATKDDFEKYFYKLLLNSLYGKFAESDMKTGLVINPSYTMMKAFDEEFTQELMPGVFITPEQVKIPHMHVPIASHITANSRKILYEYLNLSGNFHYADTDGFSCDSMFPTGNELGDLKLEKVWKHATYQAPKLYHGEGWEKKGGEWVPINVTKAKGFSLGKDKQKAEELFMQLVGEGEIRVTRMERIRTLLREAPREGLHPRETEVIKKLSKNAFGKRFMYPDGTSRPWTVEELDNAYAE